MEKVFNDDKKIKTKEEKIYVKIYPKILEIGYKLS